jgi:hypothetical protein
LIKCLKMRKNHPEHIQKHWCQCLTLSVMLHSEHISQQL